jgi:cytochrome d ubiquinol oxidase subunit II
MSAADGVLVAILLGLTAYAVLGGADFGGGVWDLLAHGPRRDAQRELIAHSMGPVWEANHVWLVFVIIGLFSGFPGAFGVLCRTLILPLSLALAGIVLRGAAFAYRQYGRPDESRPPVRGTIWWGRVFAVASTVTPFMLGVAGGAVATGDLPADGSGGVLAPFGSPLALVAGALAVMTCAFLAAVYLARDAEVTVSPATGGGPTDAGANATGLADAAASRPAGSGRGAAAAGAELVGDFRRRALGAAALAGALAIAALPLLWADAPSVAARFGRALGPAALSVAGGVAALVLLWHRRFGAARVAAAVAPAGLLWGWGLAQYPWLVVGAADVPGSAAPPHSEAAILIVLAAGMILVTPALALLLRTVRRAALIVPDDDFRAGSRHMRSPIDA